MSVTSKPEKLPVITLEDIIPLPGLIIPLYMQDDCSRMGVNMALEEDHLIACFFRDIPEDMSDALEAEYDKDPLKGVTTFGCLAKVAHCVKLSDGDLKVRLQIISRIKAEKFISDGGCPIAEVSYFADETVVNLSKEDEQTLSSVKDAFGLLASYESIPEDLVGAVKEIFDPGSLADFVACSVNLSLPDTQRILEEVDPIKRLSLVRDLLSVQVDFGSVRHRIATRAKTEMGKVQYEEMLREQLRQIQQELGDIQDFHSELEEIREKVKKTKLSKLAKVEVEKQIRRLQQMHPDSSEAALSRTYLDWILEIPWYKRTKDKIDLAAAKKVLDEDHYGLNETKERVLDFLGVRKLKSSIKGPILLFVGPPGVGKTSVGRSIARALGRKFVRIALGGLRDEAELRGHRRTYVGALPGRIVQGLKSAGSTNPVFMLDEIDKIGADFRGDPASVLLEILDPEQNSNFEDYYLNIPIDLSEVMFIATANRTDTIPGPLLDRMEVIEVSGYTLEEKLRIAKQYLCPKEAEKNGIESTKHKLTDGALRFLIESYTRESGVRELSRTISTVYRKLARLYAESKKVPRSISIKLIERLLGTRKYLRDERLKRDEVGVVTGLAWTPVGGEILFVEVAVTKGKGSLQITGQVGDVMSESAKAALTCVMSNAVEIGIDPDFYENSAIHFHIPEGAIPKDGPSAGIAMATALVSALTESAVSRNIAMTGEITLRGKVLEIGGLKEKALAAMRLGISDVIIPKDNERDIKDLPDYLLDKVEFHAVSDLYQVLELAIVE